MFVDRFVCIVHCESNVDIYLFILRTLAVVFPSCVFSYFISYCIFSTIYYIEYALKEIEIIVPSYFRYGNYMFYAREEFDGRNLFVCMLDLILFSLVKFYYCFNLYFILLET